MKSRRKIFLVIWLCVVLFFVSIYVFNPEYVRNVLTILLSKPPLWAYITLFLLGCIRGFTLIPSTILIVVGLMFIPPVPLYFIILIGVIVSSVSVFYFFEYLHIDTLVKDKYKPLLEKGSKYLSRYELPAIIIWSMAPFLPTDVICYLAGTARVNVGKFVLGILIGEGVICALYIFGASALFHAIVGV